MGLHEQFLRGQGPLILKLWRIPNLKLYVKSFCSRRMWIPRQRRKKQRMWIPKQRRKKQKGRKSTKENGMWFVIPVILIEATNYTYLVTLSITPSVEIRVQAVFWKGLMIFFFQKCIYVTTCIYLFTKQDHSKHHQQTWSIVYKLNNSFFFSTN